MGIVKGLKDLNKALDKPQPTGGSENKGRWVKLEDGESVKIHQTIMINWVSDLLQ
jgi:hypothetical protein